MNLARKEAWIGGTVPGAASCRDAPTVCASGYEAVGLPGKKHDCDHAQ